MPRRSRAELINEYERLFAIAILIVEFTESTFPISWADDDDPMRRLEKQREQLHKGKVRLSEEVSGLQEIINDCQFGLMDYDPVRWNALSPSERGPNAEAFLRFYKERTGRNFWQDTVPPKKLIGKILKQASITTEQQYFIAREFTSNCSQADLTDAQLRLIETYMHDFETSVRQIK